MKNQNQNLLVAVAIWLACMAALYVFFPNAMGRRPASEQKSAPAAQTAPAPAPAPGAAAPSSPPAAPREADVPRGTQAPKPPLRLVTLETPRARVVVSSEGAAVQSLQLLGEKWTRNKGKPDQHQVDLVTPRSGEPLPFTTAVRAADGNALVPPAAAYEVVKQDANSATFRAEQAGVTVTKTISVNPGSYGMALAVDVRAAQGVTGSLAVLSGAHADEPSGSFFTPQTTLPARAICAAANKAERKAIGDKPPVFEAASAQFAGIDEQYFLNAVMPPPGVTASCRLEVQGEKSGSLTAALVVPLQVAAGGSAQLTFQGYGGPKIEEDLAAVAAPLKHSIDLGFWAVIVELLLGIMKFFYRVVPPHNWGIAIVLLTLAMKILTFPLQHKSMKSMQEMQRIQPQIEEIKKKYAGDTQRQNLEQMKLFKEHGVNPMGSCLPMLIQMPIWFALYNTLQVSAELFNEPFIRGWIGDLTAKDPYYVLPVAMGITMVLTQMLTPTPMSNPSQKIMGYAMSGFFSLLMLSLPSGLTLYIFTNNILSIAQQMYLRRKLHHPAKAADQTVEVDKKKDDRTGGGTGASGRAKLRA